jgi:hypothetical protein
MRDELEVGGRDMSTDRMLPLTTLRLPTLVPKNWPSPSRF